ncbi:MAG: hypothetical protein HYT39_03515 [Candidatus Sungbacteria bacterium]|nr:hypothetical protein [Candidatus Sungbacteria bacterium]
MHQVLQWLGGGFYLLNKIFLSFSEHARNRGDEVRARKWRIASWAVYLVGLPPWVIIFVSWRNWIAASVEASGAPAMVLGLVIALRGTTKNPPRWLDHLALVCIPLGFGYSLYDFGGITTVNQWLEIGLVLGFLVGTYLLAKERASGYLWYVLMHVTCGWLMWIQGYPWLLLQQLVSLVFIVDAYRMTQKRRVPR